MKIKIKILSVIIIVTSFSSTFGQIVIHPNFALKSHETLDILKVEITSENTILYLSIENRIDGGTFCADKNIYLLDPEGKRLDLKKSAGIPTCPETFKFKAIGEKLQFMLEFPPLKTGTKWIDVVEDCSDNCFLIYGITLDADLNKKLDEGFSLTEKGENSKALIILKGMLANTNDNKDGIAGALYTEVITIEFKSGNIEGAKEWYKKLISSRIPRLELYIKNLNSRGIKF
jgi:hypothetical protein